MAILIKHFVGGGNSAKKQEKLKNLTKMKPSVPETI